MYKSSSYITLSVRILPEIRKKLEALAVTTERTKSFLIAEAIESYLETQAWQINAVEKAIKKADSKNAKFFDHHKVADWVKNWDKTNVMEMPK